MCAITISKIEKNNNRWAGINKNLQVGVLAEIITELCYYNANNYIDDVEYLRTHESIIVEVEWKNYTIIIQILKIN